MKYERDLRESGRRDSPVSGSFSGTADKKKEIIMGMVEREGKAYVKRIPDTSRYTLLNQIKSSVNPKARIITDQWSGYMNLRKLGYHHDYINHLDTYVEGDVHTQNVECLWSIIKRGIGVYRSVSKRYLNAYLDEYIWRYNHKNSENMFTDLLNPTFAVTHF